PDLAVADHYRAGRTRQPARCDHRRAHHAGHRRHHRRRHLAGLGDLRLLRHPGGRPDLPPAGPVRRAGPRPHMRGNFLPRVRWRIGRGPLKLVGLLGLVIAALLLPFVAPDPATTNIAVFTVMYIGLATAWNIMGGYTGYISLGHAAFFGFGAYSFGLLLNHLGMAPGYGPFFLVPLAGVFAALLAVGIGWVALRTRAATFVIVTIAFMFMLQLLAENLVKVTGGGAGLSLPYPHDWGGDFFNTPYYYAMLA